MALRGSRFFSGGQGVELCSPTLGVTFAVVRGRSMPFAMMACDCVNSFLLGCVQKVCWGGVTGCLTWQAHHFADITFFAATILSGRGNGIRHVMDVSSYVFSLWGQHWRHVH